MGTPDTYDVVIIGSGLGGMLSAVMLARTGMKVCVLEKNKQIGGCLQTFSLQKKVFDSCVHYIGGLGEGHTLHRIFRYAGIMDKLQLKSLDENGFDRIVFNDGPVSYPQATGPDRFIEELVKHFPHERSSLQNYINTLSDVSVRFPLYNLRLGSSAEKDAVTGWELAATMQRLIPDQRLRNVLLGNSLLYGGITGVTPFYLHALVQASYIHSAHKVVPGSSEISKLLWRELQSLGGVVHRNTEIIRLAEENGRIRYAETDAGERFYGRQFISNVHPAVLTQMVESRLIRPAYRQRIQRLKQTPSAFMVNLIVSPGKIPYRPYNTYWHATDDALAAAAPSGAWPQTYAVYNTEDPAFPGYAESISLLTYFDAGQMQAWSSTTNHSGKPAPRGESYMDTKNQLADKLLERVYAHMPELRGQMLARSVATPLTFRDYTHTPEGALYGIMNDVNSPAETTIAVRTRIPNLLQTGQNVNLHGVLGVSITAIATCAELLGMDYLLQKITET